MISSRTFSLRLLIWVCLWCTALSARALGESDRILLTMAKAACENRDYRSFFNAFAMSPIVRQEYSAAKIHIGLLGPRGKTISSRNIDAASYADFPVEVEDYRYKPRMAAMAGDTGEYLYLEFDQSQKNDISVEWSRIHYDGLSAGGDDLGNSRDAMGNPLQSGAYPQAEGQLLFRQAADCWEFSEDIRWQRRP
jgi:hypothetical protein